MRHLSPEPAVLLLISWCLSVRLPGRRRPLKLTGWELWLCGASNGPLFASDMNATAFDGSEVKPEVRSPT